jgi:alpha-1,6-mannosyltransferase
MLREARGRWKLVMGSTSAAATCCLVGLFASYFAFAVLAGAHRSPIAVPLPAGAATPAWSRRLAQFVGVAGASRAAITTSSIGIVVTALVLFGVVLREAVAGRVASGSVLLATCFSVVVAVAAPVLLSRDAISYVAFGRLVSLYHRNPYGVLLTRFPSDAFVRVTSRQWVRTTSVYGPATMLLSAAVARVTIASATASLIVFKVLAGLGVATAAICTLVAARAIRPERGALAAAIVGLNPVLILHTIGGGHIDGLLVGLLAGAMAIAVRTPFPNQLTRSDSPIVGSAGRLGTTPTAQHVVMRWVLVTVLLTVAMLMRIALLPALVMWLYWVARTVRPGRRLRIEALLASVVVGLAVVSFGPFFSDWRASATSVLLGGLEWWASPAHLVAHAAEAGLHGLMGGSWAAVGGALMASFLVVFLLAAWLLARRYANHAGAETLPDLWGGSLLLLVLAWPYLLPWYAAWFLPYMGLMTDEILMWMGVGVSAILAVTLIPADPPNGLTTWGVMDLVHYVVAPILLVAFVFVVIRVATGGAGRRSGGVAASPE